MKVDFCMMVFRSGSILILNEYLFHRNMGKIFLWMYFAIQDGKCKGHIFADGTIQVFANTSGHKFTLDDAKIVVMEEDFVLNYSHLALVFFGD